MINVDNVEKSIEHTVIKTEIEGKLYEFHVQSTASLEHCLSALLLFKSHIETIVENLEENKSEKTEEL